MAPVSNDLLYHGRMAHVATICIAIVAFLKFDVYVEAVGLVDPLGLPLFREFDGKTFTFRGGVRDLLYHQKRRLQPRAKEAMCAACIEGRYYNLLSEDKFQVTTLFKDVRFEKMNGTFVKGVAMRDRSVSLVAETKSDFSDKMKVLFNGEPLHIEIGSITRQITMAGGLTAVFTLAANVKDMGYTVNLTTDTASLLVYLVPPGLDRFGIWQPSYLNFELTLLRVPSKRVEGMMVADTYRLMGRETHPLLMNRLRGGSDESSGPPDFVWELTDYFAAPRYKSLARLPKAATRAIINLTKSAARLEIPPVPLSCEYDRVGAMGEIPCFEETGPASLARR